MSDELIRSKRKLMALRRAEFRLRQRLEAIDWELDELTPEVERLQEDGLIAIQSATQNPAIAEIEKPG